VPIVRYLTAHIIENGILDSSYISRMSRDRNMMLSSKTTPSRDMRGEHVTKTISRANTDARGFHANLVGW
jgi:hypothetical protein